LLVGTHDLADREAICVDAGAQDVDAVERGLAIDLFGLALVGESTICATRSSPMTLRAR
jgi:hypothetical protein